MRTETEIREKLKEIDDDGWRTGDILKSSVTDYLIETRLLKWVLEEYEYLTEDPIVEEIHRIREDLAKDAGYDISTFLNNAEKAVERIEKEYGIKWKRVTKITGDKSMCANLEKLKKDVCDFGIILENTDFSIWTPERFSKVNAMFTIVEEDFADAERELGEIEREHKELITEIRNFMRIHVQFRERYFETRDIDIEHQFRWA